LVKVQAAAFVQDINQFAQNYVVKQSSYSLHDVDWETTVNQVLNDSWAKSEAVVLNALNASSAGQSSGGQVSSATH